MAEAGGNSPGEEASATHRMSACNVRTNMALPRTITGVGLAARCHGPGQHRQQGHEQRQTRSRRLGPLSEGARLAAVFRLVPETRHAHRRAGLCGANRPVNEPFLEQRPRAALSERRFPGLGRPSRCWRWCGATCSMHE